MEDWADRVLPGPTSPLAGRGSRGTARPRLGSGLEPGSHRASWLPAHRRGAAGSRGVRVLSASSARPGTQQHPGARGQRPPVAPSVAPRWWTRPWDGDLTGTEPTTSPPNPRRAGTQGCETPPGRPAPRPGRLGHRLGHPSGDTSRAIRQPRRLRGQPPRDGGARPGALQMLPTPPPEAPEAHRKGMWPRRSSRPTRGARASRHRPRARPGVSGGRRLRVRAGRVREGPGGARAGKQESAPRATGTRGTREPPADGLAASAGVT